MSRADELDSDGGPVHSRMQGSISMAEERMCLMTSSMAGPTASRSSN